MASISFGSGSPTETLSGIVNFLAAGGNPLRLVMAMLVGTGVSLWLGFAKVIDAVATFFARPFVGAAEGLSQMLVTFFLAPAGIVEAGEAATTNVLVSMFGTTAAGLLALPAAVFLALVVLWMYARFRQEPETGEVLPGLPLDVPNFLGFIFGTEEEDPDEDEEDIG